MSTYAQPIKNLMREFARTLKRDQSFTRQSAIDWFEKNYPRIAQRTVYLNVDVMSTNNIKTRRHHRYTQPGSGHDLFYKLDRSRFRLWNRKRDPRPLYAGLKRAIPHSTHAAPTSRRLVSQLNDAAWKALADVGLVEDPKRDRIAYETGTCGWTTSAILSRSPTIRLEFWVDKFGRSPSDRFWYGLTTSTRSGQMEALLSVASKQFGRVPTYITKHVEESQEGCKRLRKKLPKNHWGRCLHEQYESHEYLGFFDTAPASVKRVAPIVSRVIDFLSKVELVPSERNEEAHGSMIEEGASGLTSARQRKRSADLRRYAREHYREDGVLACRVCGFAKPTSIGPEIVQIHHLKTIKSFNPKGEKKRLVTALRNVRPLCPTCHAIAHTNRTKPLTLREIARHRKLRRRFAY